MSTAGCRPRASSRSSPSACCDLGVRARQQLAHRGRVAVEPPLGEPQRERGRDEPLLRAVVEVALQPAALGVARLDDPRARGGELVARLGVGERLRGELGEARDALLVAGRERAAARTDETITAPHSRPPSDDRRGDGAAEAERPQPRGELAGQAVVVVDARGPARPPAPEPRRCRRRAARAADRRRVGSPGALQPPTTVASAPSS